MTDKKTIRKLFIAVMILLPLQYGAVGIVGLQDAEPWPAFVFPGFKSVPVSDGAFETEQKMFVLVPVSAREDTIHKTPAELFPEIPVSQLSGFMRHNFSDERDFTPISNESKSWLLHLAEATTGVKLSEISLKTVIEYRRFVNGAMKLDSTAVLREQTIVRESL